MIGSKYVNFSISTWLQGRLTIELISQNTSSNQSTYKAKIHISRKNNETFRYGNSNASLYTTISGPGYSSSTKNRTYDWYISSSWVLVREETVTVTHNTNGTPPSSTFYGAITDSYQGWNGNASLTYTFPTIPRYTSITSFKSSSIQRDRFTISWTAANTVNYWWYSLNDGSTWTAVGNPASTTASRTITGLSPATGYNVKVKVRRSDSNLETTSSRLVVTTEATASPNTPTISEITRNSFKINVTANKSFNGFVYNINGGAWSAKQSGTSVTVTGRTAGTTHSVRVRVYDGVHTSSLSGQSAAASAVTLSAASPNTPTLAGKTAIQITFDWSSNRAVTNVRYKRWSSDTWQSAGADFTARTSGRVTITGLSPNTGYSISVQVKDEAHGSWSGGSGNLSVTTYALSTVKGTDFNLGSSVTATVTEAHTSMYHDIVLEANYGGSWKQVASVDNQNKNASLTIPPATITAIENGTPNSKTVPMRLKVTSKWGSNGIVQGPAEESPQFKATIVNANPTLSGITYKDNHSNPDFVNWKGGDEKILRNVSPVLATLGRATARRGAKLSHYVFNINGKSFALSANGTTTQTGAIIDLGVIDSATNESIEVTVYDSRNNSTPMSVPVSMIDYIPPQVLKIEAQRLNDYEPNTTLVVSGRSYIVKDTAGDNVNTFGAKYRIKEAGTSNWPQNYTPVVVTKGTESGNWQNHSINHYMGTFDSDKSYDIEFVFQDRVGIQYTQKAVLTQGIGLMEFFEDKVELGVPLYDKNSTKRYLLEGEGGTDLVTVLKAVYPVGAIYTSVTATNPSSIFGFGTWVSFGAGRTLVGVNTSDTAFNTVEKTGGSKTNTLAIANLPAHTHTFTGNATGSAGGHSHTITVNSGGAHTHSISGTAASAGAHTHAPHDDTIVNSTAATDWYTSNAGAGWYHQAVTKGRSFPSKSAGAHTHSVSGTAASAGAHTHTASSNSTGAHTHTVSGSNANTGSGTAFNTMDPYITVYMWKRTA